MQIKRIPVSLQWPGEDEAHVWTAYVSETSRWQSSFIDILSPEEKQRAARFIRSGDRARYIAAHGILRQLLGRYLAAEPTLLEFVTNAAGKPSLGGNEGRLSLTFNLAHSGDIILFVVASGRRVGVDVEAIRTDLDVMELARHQFSSQEVVTLGGMSVAERGAAFFRCWTHKEAYVKALGVGLGFVLKDFSVIFEPASESGLLWVKDEPAAPAGWSARALELPTDYAGAVFAEGAGVRFILCGLPPLH